MCSTWLAAVFGETTRRRAICLFEWPRASSRRTSTSRAVSPAGHGATGGRAVTRRRQHGVGRVPVQAAGADLGRAGRRAACTGSSGRPVRPRFGHRVIDVRGREQPVGRRERGRGQPARVAGPVEPFVVSGRRSPGWPPSAAISASIRSVRYGCSRTRSRLGLGQRAGLVPDRVGDAEPAEVVEQSPPGAASRRRPSDSPADPGGLAARLATPREWPARYGDFRSTRSAMATSTSSSSARRPGGTAAARRRGSRPSRRPRPGRPAPRRHVRRTDRPARVELGAARLRAMARAASSAAPADEDLDRAGELDEPRGQADLLAAQVARLTRCRPTARRPGRSPCTTAGSSPIRPANCAPKRAVGGQERSDQLLAGHGKADQPLRARRHRRREIRPGGA